MERQKDNISAGLDALPEGGGVGPSELSLCGNGERCSRIGFPVRPSPSMLGTYLVHRLAEKTAKSGISMHLFSHQDVTTETLTSNVHRDVRFAAILHIPRSDCDRILAACRAKSGDWPETANVNAKAARAPRLTSRPVFGLLGIKYAYNGEELNVDSEAPQIL